MLPLSTKSHQHEHHGHGDGETPSRTKLAVVTVLNVVWFVLELIGGLLFGSVALISDALHTLTDATAYATAFAAAYIAETVEARDRWTYGFHRVEVISALLNGFLLIPMAGWIVWEAYQHVLSPVEMQHGPVLVIAIGGVAINLLCVLYLHRSGGLSLNEKGAFYHLLADTGSSAAVGLGAIAIWATGITVIDPLIAVIISVVVVWSATRILMEGVGIILQRSPIDPEDIERVVEATEGVVDAHDIRCWRVCSNVNVCTVHAEMNVETLAEAEELREQITDDLKDRFNLQHVTLQIEDERSHHNHVNHE